MSLTYLHERDEFDEGDHIPADQMRRASGWSMASITVQLLPILREDKYLLRQKSPSDRVEYMRRTSNSVITDT